MEFEACFFSMSNYLLQKEQYSLWLPFTTGFPLVFDSLMTLVMAQLVLEVPPLSMTVLLVSLP